MSDALLKRKHPSARERAMNVLVECFDGQRRAGLLLDELQSTRPLPARDAGLAAELALGTLRWRLTCEHLASRFHRGRWDGLQPRIRLILAMAVYQLVWLERIPDHAAVDQAVRQAQRFGRAVAGLVNAVLRQLIDARGTITEFSADVNRKRCVRIDERRIRQFKLDVLPDPARRPLEYVIAATSHPAWLVERWHRRFKHRPCLELCELDQRRPGLTLRPNRLRITEDALLKRLLDDGLNARRIGESQAIALPPGTDLAALSMFQEGLCQPQDATAQLALDRWPPRPGERVLDLCAGVGTKSTQAAEHMGNQGEVIAGDIDPGKLERIAPAAERLGISIIRTALPEDLDNVATAGRPLDWILVDAPCSNTGVLSRRPEARYRASQRSLLELAELQRRILTRAVELCGPQTRLIYSTCSLEPEENEQQITWLCGQFPGWRCADQVFTMPDTRRDGGFAALLTRK